MSRKNLSLIHLVAGIGTTSIDVLEALHHGSKSFDIAFAAGVGLKPFAEGGVESCVLGLGNSAGFLDEVGVGA